MPLKRRRKYGEIWAADPDWLGSQMSLGPIFVEIANGRDSLAVPAVGIRLFWFSMPANE